MSNPSNPALLAKVLVFDFDGVIIDSVEAKGLAFQRLYEAYGGVVMDKVLNHHLKAGGVSRYDKIRFYHKEFLGKSLSTQEVEALAQKYSSLVEELVLGSPLVAGALEFFEKWKNKKRMFVASATPQAELHHILDRLDLSKYFEKTWGYPTKKAEAIKTALQITQVRTKEVWMIGDSLSDLEASRQTDVGFVGRRTPLVQFPSVCTIVDDFHGLDGLLAKSE